MTRAAFTQLQSIPVVCIFDLRIVDLLYKTSWSLPDPRLDQLNRKLDNVIDKASTSIIIEHIILRRGSRLFLNHVIHVLLQSRDFQPSTDKS